MSTTACSDLHTETSRGHVHLSQLLVDYHSKGVKSEEEPTKKDRVSMIAVIRQFFIEKEKDHSSHEMEDVQVMEDLTYSF